MSDLDTVLWEMDYDQAEEYQMLADQLECYEITQEEFSERLTMMAGYPLGRELLPGETLRILVKNKKPLISVPRNLGVN